MEIIGDARHSTGGKERYLVKKISSGRGRGNVLRRPRELGLLFSLNLSNFVKIGYQWWIQGVVQILSFSYSFRRKYSKIIGWCTALGSWRTPLGSPRSATGYFVFHCGSKGVLEK